MNDPVYERSVAFAVTRSEEVGDGLTLEGYAAVFNSPTHIDSAREGEFDEVIAPGAFKRSINAGTPVLMFEHGAHPLYGSMPIGKINDLREDPRGLFVRARLFDHWLNQPLRDAIDAQAIEGMSFRFSVPTGKDKKTRQEDGTTLRTIYEAKLYELGPVTFPAYRDTTVALRSLAATVPGLTLTLDQGATSVETRDAEADPVPPAGTPEEPAAERSTSDGPAATKDDPADDATRPPTPSTADERKHRGRQIQTARLGVRKK